MLHSNVVVGDNHYIQQWSVADNTARDALVVTADDVGKVCQVTGTAKFFILSDDSPMTWIEVGGGGGSGDVVGPASSTDNAAVRFDGTSGKLVQNSAVTIADTSGDITAGKYNTVAISGSSTPTLAVTGTTTVSGANTGDQNLFSTIAVSGQSNVVADTTTDTLTLVAGTNVTITTDASTDSVTINAASGGITLGTPQNSTSGTTIDFTGIPSGTKEITIMFDGVSSNGTAVFLVQLGTSGGIETSGYSGGIHIAVSSGANTILTNSSGFQISGSAAADTFTGVCNLYLMNSSTNKWAEQSSTFRDSSTDIYNNSSGIKSLSGVLDRVRITSGDTFDLGSINIQYSS